MTRSLCLSTGSTLVPFIVFVAIVAGGLVPDRRSRPATARPRSGWTGSAGRQSLADIEMSRTHRRQRFSGLKDAIANLGGAAEAADRAGEEQAEDQAGQRRLPQRDSAPMIYQGLRLLCIVAVPGPDGRLICSCSRRVHPEDAACTW